MNNHEAKIFHEKNDLGVCFYYWSHYNNTGFILARLQLKSTEPLLYKQSSIRTQNYKLCRLQYRIKIKFH